jgi:hypothetical protein
MVEDPSHRVVVIAALRTEDEAQRKVARPSPEGAGCLAGAIPSPECDDFLDPLAAQPFVACEGAFNARRVTQAASENDVTVPEPVDSPFEYCGSSPAPGSRIDS